MSAPGFLQDRTSLDIMDSTFNTLVLVQFIKTTVNQLRLLMGFCMKSDCRCLTPTWSGDSFVSQTESDTEQLEPWLLREMDSCIYNVFLNEDQDTFIQLFNLILYENVNGTTLRVDLCSHSLYWNRSFIVQLTKCGTLLVIVLHTEQFHVPSFVRYVIPWITQFSYLLAKNIRSFKNNECVPLKHWANTPFDGCSVKWLDV